MNQNESSDASKTKKNARIVQKMKRLPTITNAIAPHLIYRKKEKKMKSKRTDSNKE